MFGRQRRETSGGMIVRGRRLASPRGVGEGATLRATAKPGTSVAFLHNPKFASLTGAMMANPIACVAAKPAAATADSDDAPDRESCDSADPAESEYHDLHFGFNMIEQTR